jgi:putative DNA primase/helicase
MKDQVKQVAAFNYTPDDGGMMDAWLDLYMDDWFYVHQHRSWYEWQKTHWQEEGSSKVGRMIQHMLKSYNKAVRFSLNGQEGDARKKIKSYISATRRSRSRISSIETMAANELGVDAREVDRKDIINFKNGSFDIDGLELREHDREDLLTNCLPYEYDPDASSPVWDQYLEHLPTECMLFLQEFAGYSLTTETRYEVAVWLHGPPGSGKSTFINGIQFALGYRSGILSLTALENDRFALANIPGKTLLVSTEQPALHMRASAKLNKIISGEKVNIDQKYREAYAIEPYAKILWAMNQFPIVKDTSDGIFRRVKVVRFREVHKKIPELKERFEKERAGIFNWMVDGLKRLRDRGHFEIPDAVKEATEEFVDENDIARAFVKENCAIGPEYEEASSDLHEAFNGWCEENEFKTLSPYKLAQEWKRLGFEKYKAPTGMRWVGLKLRRRSLNL